MSGFLTPAGTHKHHYQSRAVRTKLHFNLIWLTWQRKSNRGAKASIWDFNHYIFCNLIMLRMFRSKSKSILGWSKCEPNQGRIVSTIMVSFSGRYPRNQAAIASWKLRCLGFDRILAGCRVIYRIRLGEDMFSLNLFQFCFLFPTLSFF